MTILISLLFLIPSCNLISAPIFSVKTSQSDDIGPTTTLEMNLGYNILSSGQNDYMVIAHRYQKKSDEVNNAVGFVLKSKHDQENIYTLFKINTHPNRFLPNIPELSFYLKDLDFPLAMFNSISTRALYIPGFGSKMTWSIDGEHMISSQSKLVYGFPSGLIYEYHEQQHSWSAGVRISSTLYGIDTLGWNNGHIKQVFAAYRYRHSLFTVDLSIGLESENLTLFKEGNHIQRDLDKAKFATISFHA